MAFNLQNAVALAKSKGPNMTEAQGGGGDYELPAAGFTRLRFVGYFELGKKEGEWQGKKKINDECELVFELSGPKHPPRVTDNGTFPIRITVKQNIKLNERANFFKLFTAMNWENQASHIAELLGKDFVGEVEHNVVKGKKPGDQDRTFCNLINIRKPFATNPETGDEYRINVDAPLTELKLFLFDFATPEMWDSIYIDGEYEARKDKDGKEIAPARSKNVIQNKIKQSLNWKASPVYDYAIGKVTQSDAAALDEVMGGDVQTAVAVDDPLNGVA